jgi:hypothetical protein
VDTVLREFYEEMGRVMNVRLTEQQVMEAPKCSLGNANKTKAIYQIYQMIELF